MERNKSSHFVTMYILIAILAVALAFTAFSMSSRDAKIAGADSANNKWECSRVVCGKYVDPVAWVAKNCASVAAGDSAENRSCSVNIEGTVTPVPLSFINLTFVASQCEEVACVQEVLTRPANFTVPAPVQ